jgi:hypothetical protein
MGGGAAATGRALLHLEGTAVEQNHASGGPRGLGGGVMIWRGATLQTREVEIASNRADSAGGGVAVLNGSLSMVEGTSVNRNIANSGAGGGVLILTLEDPILERLVGQPGFEIPFRCKLDGARLSHNQARGAGGGLRVGNRGASPTFPLQVGIRRPDWINDNKSVEKAERFGQICIRWAGQVVGDDTTRGRVKKVFQ